MIYVGWLYFSFLVEWQANMADIEGCDSIKEPKIIEFLRIITDF
jgi:hypothetical protein